MADQLAGPGIVLRVRRGDQPLPVEGGEKDRDRRGGDFLPAGVLPGFPVEPVGGPDHALGGEPDAGLPDPKRFGGHLVYRAKRRRQVAASDQAVLGQGELAEPLVQLPDPASGAGVFRDHDEHRRIARGGELEGDLHRIAGAVLANLIGRQEDPGLLSATEDAERGLQPFPAQVGQDVERGQAGDFLSGVTEVGPGSPIGLDESEGGGVEQVDLVGGFVENAAEALGEILVAQAGLLGPFPQHRGHRVEQGREAAQLVLTGYREIGPQVASRHPGHRALQLPQGPVEPGTDQPDREQQEHGAQHRPGGGPAGDRPGVTQQLVFSPEQIGDGDALSGAERAGGRIEQGIGGQQRRSGPVPSSRLERAHRVDQAQSRRGFGFHRVGQPQAHGIGDRCRRQRGPQGDHAVEPGLGRAGQAPGGIGR